MPTRRGGARKGAGRKRTRDLYERPIRAAEKKIADRLPKLLDNMIVLADGVTVQEVDKDGGVGIYTRPPDRAANEYLINRILGKPTEMTEADVNVTENGRITIRTINVVKPQPQADADD